MGDQNSTVENGFLNYENTVLVRKQAKDLGSALITFCLTAECIKGLDADEEKELLLEAAKALTAIDDKLGKSLEHQRKLLYINKFKTADATAK